MMFYRLIRGLQRRLFPARETIEGYEHAELVEMIFQKTKAHDPRGDWPLMAGVRSVLDFGGGCGVYYKLARRQAPDIRWAVVETPAMARRASELATDRLRFFSDIEQAATWLGSIEVMNSNGALQYTQEPLQILRQLCGLAAKTIFWERVLFSASDMERDIQSTFLSENGPPGGLVVQHDKIVKYVRTRIPEAKFMAAHEHYELAERGNDWFRFTLKTAPRELAH
jgi:hypothetical protein